LLSLRSAGKMFSTIFQNPQILYTFSNNYITIYLTCTIGPFCRSFIDLSSLFVEHLEFDQFNIPHPTPFSWRHNNTSTIFPRVFVWVTCLFNDEELFFALPAAIREKLPFSLFALHWQQSWDNPVKEIFWCVLPRLSKPCIPCIWFW